MRRGFTRMEWAVVAVILLVLAVILYPLTLQTHHGLSAEMMCRSNLKQLATACAFYQEDYDGQFPGAAHWRDATLAYTASPPGYSRLYQCPPSAPGPTGYAFNTVLNGLARKELQYPKSTPMLFDSTLQLPNASDRLQSFARRHGAGDRGAVGNVLFVDGHQEALRKAPPALP